MTFARTVRRHQRALILAWLGSCAVLLGVIGIWGVGMGGAERVIDFILTDFPIGSSKQPQHNVARASILKHESRVDMRVRGRPLRPG